MFVLFHISHDETQSTRLRRKSQRHENLRSYENIEEEKDSPSEVIDGESGEFGSITINILGSKIIFCFFNSE